MRLDKFLSQCDLGTRSQCKELLKKGYIKVNGEVEKDGARKLKEQEIVLYQDIPLNSTELNKELYFMFHKPAGCVSANHDDRDKTVLDYFEDTLKKKLMIVGRLDKDTEGLLLLTTDGQFCHTLTSPRKHLNKNYYFEADGELKSSACEQVKQGMDIGDEKLTKPGELKYEQANGKIKGELTITEGRFHQVKRMIHGLGGEITYLKRISIGDLKLPEDLQKGQYRPLTDMEIEQCLFYQLAEKTL